MFGVEFWQIPEDKIYPFSDETGSPLEFPLGTFPIQAPISEKKNEKLFLKIPKIKCISIV